LKLVDGNQNAKCFSGGVHGGVSGVAFKSVIFIARNPINAMRSEFNRKITKSHVGVVDISKDIAVQKKWIEFLESNIPLYGQQFQTIIKPMLESMPKSHTIVIKYENLINKVTQVQELSKLLSFLTTNNCTSRTPSLPPPSAIPSFRENSQIENENEIHSLIRCAFSLSESPRTHRKNEGLRTGYMHNITVVQNDRISIQYAKHLGEFHRLFNYKESFSVN
jgi:hypothetical protein